MSWLENTWTLLRLGVSLLARPSLTVLNSAANLEISAAQALDLARAGDFLQLEKAAFQIPKQELEARAFWLNIYNALTLHAMHTAQIKETVLESVGFYSKFGYQIQDFVFTLNDIEHGVLRHNQAVLLQPPFGLHDPRMVFVLPLDPRIHFALNCGAVSCPPIRAYDAMLLDQQLELATSSYLENCRLEADTVWLPRLFAYYPKDFASPLEFARKYRPELPNTAKIKYLPYAWQR